MLVSFVLLIVFKIHKGQCLEGLNVCEDRRSKTEYCCSGYEDKHGICIECNIGFTSINGNSCTPCGNNRFGERCLARCNCQSVERCDNVVGCVPKKEVREDVVYTTKTLERGFPGTTREDAPLPTQIKENSLSLAVTESVAATNKTKDKSLSVTTKDNDIAYTLSEHTHDSTRTQEKGFPDTQTENTAYSTRTTRESFPETQTVLKLKWFVYCGGIAGFILLVGVCFACVQFRKRRQKPSTSITNDENRILRVSGKGNQNPPEQKKSMHIYHTIDDNILSGPNTNCYAYSEVLIESSSQKSKKSRTETACSYAQPYQSLVPETLEMHHYR